MSSEVYSKANKLAKKDYQSRLMRGEVPTLPVLDDILPPKGEYTEVSLGLVQIPVEEIVGTKNAGRSNAFAANFMPLLAEGSEFAAKWAALYRSQENEGIRDPIKAYEYMNRFYVEEGNKRVSVMKYVGMVTAAANVTRLIPRRTAQKENRIYYEFLDFYELSQVNYIQFSEPGRFKDLQRAVGKEPGEVWTEEDQMRFRSIYTRFAQEFKKRNKERLKITPGDAFLSFIKLYDYSELLDLSPAALGTLISNSWEEYEILDKNPIDLQMDPGDTKPPVLNIILAKNVLPVPKQKLKIAFIYEKTPTESPWTYGHELGRLHLEQVLHDDITTVYYTNADKNNVDELIADAIAAKCGVIFTTSPTLVKASVKAAIDHPHVHILNCSLNTSHRYIRTYYIRMHEAKFLMGAIAGALSEDGNLGYVADYPIFGTIAGINAFALGAKLVNPRAKVYLEWSTKKEMDAVAALKSKGVRIISGQDMVVPEAASRYFGLFELENDLPKSLAMPVWHWGHFYERLVRSVINGTWKKDDDTSDKKAINYWWGMSSGVAEVICSKILPIGTQRLVDLLVGDIKNGTFLPFAGQLYDQNGETVSEPGHVLSPEEVMKMEWLASNVIGSIPKTYELKQESKPVIEQQGVEKTKEP